MVHFLSFLLLCCLLVVFMYNGSYVFSAHQKQKKNKGSGRMWRAEHREKKNYL
jgi:hypothetical protein